ncbi:MAG: hypothetical protein J7K31_02185 [Candidatus Aenigmarchaeota archaeon]|nr:hypothetical protein [Candidatus Aenigmarchaeota archaeon]
MSSQRLMQPQTQQPEVGMFEHFFGKEVGYSTPSVNELNVLEKYLGDPKFLSRYVSYLVQNKDPTELIEKKALQDKKLPEIEKIKENVNLLKNNYQSFKKDLEEINQKCIQPEINLVKKYLNKETLEQYNRLVGAQNAYRIGFEDYEFTREPEIVPDFSAKSDKKSKFKLRKYPDMPTNLTFLDIFKDFDILGYYEDLIKIDDPEEYKSYAKKKAKEIQSLQPFKKILKWELKKQIRKDINAHLTPEIQKKLEENFSLLDYIKDPKSYDPLIEVEALFKASYQEVSHRTAVRLLQYYEKLKDLESYTDVILNRGIWSAKVKKIINKHKEASSLSAWIQKYLFRNDSMRIENIITEEDARTAARFYAVKDILKWWTRKKFVNSYYNIVDYLGSEDGNIFNASENCVPIYTDLDTLEDMFDEYHKGNKYGYYRVKNQEHWYRERREDDGIWINLDNRINKDAGWSYRLADSITDPLARIYDWLKPILEETKHGGKAMTESKVAPQLSPFIVLPLAFFVLKTTAFDKDFRKKIEKLIKKSTDPEEIIKILGPIGQRFIAHTAALEKSRAREAPEPE